LARAISSFHVLARAIDLKEGWGHKIQLSLEVVWRELSLLSSSGTSYRSGGSLGHKIHLSLEVVSHELPLIFLF
jgi:hypothetical protein